MDDFYGNRISIVINSTAKELSVIISNNVSQRESDISFIRRISERTSNLSPIACGVVSATRRRTIRQLDDTPVHGARAEVGGQIGVGDTTIAERTDAEANGHQSGFWVGKWGLRLRERVSVPGEEVGAEIKGVVVSSRRESGRG